MGANLWQEAQKAQLKRECEEEIASKMKEKDSRIQELEGELRRHKILDPAVRVRKLQAHHHEVTGWRKRLCARAAAGCLALWFVASVVALLVLFEQGWTCHGPRDAGILPWRRVPVSTTLAHLPWLVVGGLGGWLPVWPPSPSALSRAHVASAGCISCCPSGGPSVSPPAVIGHNSVCCPSAGPGWIGCKV